MRAAVRAAGPSLAAALLAACAATPAHRGDETLGPAAAGRRVWLTDRNRDRFDITHAVGRYGMHREWFEFGIGKNAIPPLDHPRMLEPGEAGYPSRSRRRVGDVIGTTLGEEARGYPIQSIVRHEIVNDTFGDLEAAVAY